MSGTLEKKSNIEQSHNAIQKIIEQFHNIDHTTYAYVMMIGVWDVLGNNKLDQQLLIRGRTEHLKQLKQQLCEAIDTEIERRENEIK